MNSKFFDKWDYELILTFKRYEGSDRLKHTLDLWCRRCGTTHEHIEVCYIVHRLSQIIEHLYKETGIYIFSTINILEESAPSKSWMYPEVTSNSGEGAYWERLLYTYSSILRHTESKYLDGINEYFKNVWEVEGKP